MWSSPRIRSRNRTGPPGRRAKPVVAALAAASLALGGVAAVVTAEHSSPEANAAPVAAAGSVSEKAFINRVAPWAKESQNKFGVPASVSIAQAILESSWGQSTLTSEYNAYFGIKCSKTSPYAKGCVDMSTWEVIDGSNTTVKAGFRTYATPRDSFMDHGNFLKVNSRYAKAFNYPKNADQFIREVHKAGYATDPNYSTKVINLMGRYNLYSFDGTATKAPTTKAPTTKAPTTKAPTTKAPTKAPGSTTGKSATPSSTAKPSTTATPSSTATPKSTASPVTPRATATQTSTPSKTATPSATTKVTAVRAQDPNVLPMPKSAPVKKATTKAATAGKPGLPSTGA